MEFISCIVDAAAQRFVLGSVLLGYSLPMWPLDHPHTYPPPTEASTSWPRALCGKVKSFSCTSALYLWSLSHPPQSLCQEEIKSARHGLSPPPCSLLGDCKLIPWQFVPTPSQLLKLLADQLTIMKKTSLFIAKMNRIPRPSSFRDPPDGHIPSHVAADHLGRCCPCLQAWLLPWDTCHFPC